MTHLEVRDWLDSYFDDGGDVRSLLDMLCQSLPEQASRERHLRAIIKLAEAYANTAGL